MDARYRLDYTWEQGIGTKSEPEKNKLKHLASWIRNNFSQINLQRRTLMQNRSTWNGVFGTNLYMIDSYFINGLLCGYTHTVHVGARNCVVKFGFYVNGVANGRFYDKDNEQYVEYANGKPQGTFLNKNIFKFVDGDVSAGIGYCAQRRNELLTLFDDIEIDYFNGDLRLKLNNIVKYSRLIGIHGDVILDGSIVYCCDGRFII